MLQTITNFKEEKIDPIESSVIMKDDMNILQYFMDSAKELLEDLSPFLLTTDGESSNPYVFKALSEESPLLLQKYI